MYIGFALVEALALFDAPAYLDEFHRLCLQDTEETLQLYSVHALGATEIE